MIPTFMHGAVIAAILGMTSMAVAGPDDYVFEPVKAEVKRGDDAIVAVPSDADCHSLDLRGGEECSASVTAAEAVSPEIVTLEARMKHLLISTLGMLGASIVSPALAAEGDPGRGQRVFAACAACHSLEPTRNMTGPSLSELWNRQAGGLASFPRYSPALKSSGIIWEDGTLDEFLKDPQQFIAGNQMTFRGLSNAQQRADLLAYLKQATQPGQAAAQPPQGPGGGMMGMMGGGSAPNLRKLDQQDRVETIRYCPDTYWVVTADGKIHTFWERNLRFKTDSSGEGPEHGAPAIVDAGMLGDRASVIFASPEEIGRFINRGC